MPKKMNKVAPEQVIGVDNGYSQTKTSNFCFYSSYQDLGENRGQDDDDLLFFGGSYYKISPKAPGEIADRREGDSTMRIMTMFALAKEILHRGLPTEGKDGKGLDICLAIGLPPNDYMDDARSSSFKSYFTDSDQGGSYWEFEYGDKPFKINIESVDLYLQGNASFYQSEEVSKASGDNPEDFIIIDVGGRTTDIISFVHNQHDYSATFHIEKGVLSIYEAVADDIVSEDPILKGAVTIDRIAGLRKKDRYGADQKTKARFSELANEIVEQCIAHEAPIVDSIKYITGGGASDIIGPLKNEHPAFFSDDEMIVDLDVNGNARGYEYNTINNLNQKGLLILPEN